MPEIKFCCPFCAQRFEAPSDMEGIFMDCPSCDRKIQISAPPIPPPLPPIPPPLPAMPPPLPSTSNSDNRITEPIPPPIPSHPKVPEIKSHVTGQSSNSPLHHVQEFICNFSGLDPLQNFSWETLISSAFSHRSSAEVDEYLNCGCSRTTPEISNVSIAWPQPWLFWRMLIFGLMILIGFVVAYETFDNTKLIPGLIIVGAFFVPLACVALFFELNVLRNIPLYQIGKFVVAGGILSIIAALTLYSTTKLSESFLGVTAAGIVEEIAKVLAAVVLLKGLAQYKWILNGMLVGAAVGAGFAGFESAGYIYDVLVENSSSGTFYSVLIQRAIFSPFCHVVWTACAVGALWRVKANRQFQWEMLLSKDFLRILSFVILLHMLWNSGFLWKFPRNIILLRGELYFWLTSIVGSWYLALLLVHQGLLQLKAHRNQV